MSDNNEIPGLLPWLKAAAEELDLPEETVVPGPALNMSKTVSHTVIRPGAPTTTYLMGVALGLALAENRKDRAAASLGTPEEVDEADFINSTLWDMVHRVEELAQNYVSENHDAGGEA